MQRDPGYLLDMLLAAREARQLGTGLSWEQFQQSRLHHYALVKLIENIGEAARCVSEPTKATHPDIPWTNIVLMRNHLVHRYFRIDLTAVWDVLNNHLPPLIAQLEPLIPSETPPPSPPPTGEETLA